MAFTTRIYSKGRIDKAGKELITLAEDDPGREETLNVINNWRSCHGYPLQIIKMTLLNRAKHIESAALIAQRLKRIPSIAIKLKDNPNMKLSQMQDIGGCRAVMPSVRDLNKLHAVFEKSKSKNPHDRPVWIDTDDYVTHPKADGYRSIHLIYKYQSKSESKQPFNGQRIEIQMRSRAQHAKERRRVGRALTHEEKVRLLKIAESKPEWQNARLAQILALNTTMRGCEIKGQRWQDINLVNRALTVRRATTKTDAGERIIPLNGNAVGAIVELYRRAQMFDGIEGDHYIFPACENGRIDPTRPQTTWRTAWRRLTRAILCPACGELQNPGDVCQNEKCKADIRSVKSSTSGLRFHDLRHHAITELAESQASDQIVMAIAGHVSPKMLAHYSHVRMDAKRRALDALASESSGNSYVTNHDTKNLPAVSADPQVIEINGRLVGTRTPDLHRVKVAL
jgi:integrase